MAVREVLARANSDPTAIIAALGEPTRFAVNMLYRSEELSILNIVWSKHFVDIPRDHRVWAVIGAEYLRVSAV
jgi:hypothetical protein